ncbi:MAG: FtsX-like permease family protein [Cyclobacteriaceae bacterium]|nr:FtsX-like permease family protein [Cyclobacteriaceae bacterium]
MNLKENIREGFKSIKSNLLRTILTASIIAIGITSLVGILTAIDGIRSSIDTSFSSLGANSFDIRRKRPDRTVQDGKEQKKYPLLQKDEVLEFKDRFTEGTTTLHMWVSGTAEIKRLSKKTTPNFSVQGIDENYMLIRNYNIENGRNFTALDIQNGANYVLIGNEVVENLFKNEDPINKKISFYGNTFIVIGVLEKKGGFGGNTNADRTVFLPLKNAIRIADRGWLDYVLTISLRDQTRMEHAIGEATSLMRTIRKDGIGEENSFDISANKTLEEELNEMASYLRIGGFSIGFITLVGASIGLMNIMLVSVTERTREIGIRKAIGATPLKIRLQFLIEAILICIMGGLGGVILGLAIGNVVANLIKAGNFVAPWEWVFMGFIVCLVVGLISGYYPAYKASKLDPIESLRYE